MSKTNKLNTAQISAFLWEMSSRFGLGYLVCSDSSYKREIFLCPKTKLRKERYRYSFKDFTSMKFTMGQDQYFLCTLYMNIGIPSVWQGMLDRLKIRSVSPQRRKTKGCLRSGLTSSGETQVLEFYRV